MVFTARAIVEVLGYPEEHVNEVAKNVLEKLKTEQGIKIVKETLNKAEKVKDVIFSSFIEVEIKINDFQKLMDFCYNYLPSTLEILDSNKVIMPIREFTNGLNELLTKLHHYNLVMNNLIHENSELKEVKLKKEIKEEAKNN